MSGGDPPHLLWHAEIADSDLPEHGLHVGSETVGQVLGKNAAAFTFHFETVMHSEKMKRQEEKAALDRVGNAKRLIENGKPRLRHNRAIEFRGLRIGCFEGGEGVQRTVRLV